jgi:uncharacterized membrane protein YidH (DUF202 family)
VSVVRAVSALLDHLQRSAAPLEVVWTCLGLFGVGMGVGIVWTWWRWYRALSTTPMGVQYNHQAMTHLVTHALVLTQHVVVLLIGVLAVLTPPADPRARAVVTPVGVALTVGLFTIEVVALLLQVWLVWRWEQLRRIVRVPGG